MDFSLLVNSSMMVWGLLGILLLVVTILAFWRNRLLGRGRAAILVIGLVLLTVLVALSVGGR